MPITSNYIQATDGYFYQLSIVDNGDGTFSEQYTRVADPGPNTSAPGVMLVQDLFIAMMEIIGATTLDETPDASDMQKCLRHTNLMLASWSGRKLLLQTGTQEFFQLVPGQRSYTIGFGGNFNTPKPINITSAFIRDTSGVDFNLTVMERDEYDAIEDKLLTTGRPEAIFYDAGSTQQSAQMGAINCYGTPDAPYLLAINSQKYLTEFTNLTDAATFAPAYFRAIVYNGAIAIWRPMGRRGAIPADIQKAADESLRIIENINHRLPIMKIDLPGTSAPSDESNIMSGDWI